MIIPVWLPLVVYMIHPLFQKVSVMYKETANFFFHCVTDNMWFSVCKS